MLVKLTIVFELLVLGPPFTKLVERFNGTVVLVYNPLWNLLLSFHHKQDIPDLANTTSLPSCLPQDFTFYCSQPITQSRTTIHTLATFTHSSFNIYLSHSSTLTVKKESILKKIIQQYDLCIWLINFSLYHS